MFFIGGSVLVDLKEFKSQLQDHPYHIFSSPDTLLYVSNQQTTATI